MIVQAADRLKNVGEYYFSQKLEVIRQLRAAGHDVINLGIGSPDLAPSVNAIDAAAQALRSEKNHGYAAYRSTPELRRAMADWYGRAYGVKLNPETDVLPLLGSKEGILYTSIAFLNPGDTVLVPNPGYPAYSSVSALLGLNVIHYDLTDENGWLPDFAALDKLDLSRCKLMWANYPHMPTGRAGSAELFEKLVAFGHRKKIVICNDNPYGLVLNRDKPLSILNFDPSREVAIELNSLSKSFNMAGWRVGMLMGGKDAVNAVLQVKSNVDSGMFTPIQVGAAEALKNPDSWHDERNALYRERREAVWRIFDRLGFTYDKNQVGLFVWAKAPERVKDVGAYVDELLDKTHVFLTPGFIFGSNGKRYARSSLCAPKATLTEALKRVESFAGGQRMKLTVVGLGLIGGSLALDLKRRGFATEVTGVDTHAGHCEQALTLGLVDRVAKLDEGISLSDLVILAVPVGAIQKLLPHVLTVASPNTTVTDMGSTKAGICQAVASHPRRAQYVASHPMAGTENSGPQAALRNLFEGKTAVICDPGSSGKVHLERVQKMYQVLGMRQTTLSPTEHDLHAAYVSHLSHISSFVLANTVLAVEKNANTIFDLAGGGFESTVRLAKSSPEMWGPIFEENHGNVCAALESYIAHLEAFHHALKTKDFKETHRLMEDANSIRRVLADIRSRGEGDRK